MSFQRIMLKLSLIFSETCFFGLLYFCLIGSFQGRCLMNPAVFFIPAALLSIANLMIAGQNWRRLTIGLVNLLLIGVMIAGMVWRAGPVFGLMPGEALPALNLLLFDFLFLWLGFRAVYLTYRKRLPDLYSHFDWLVILTFLILLIMGLTKISLPGGMIWISAAFFFNLLPLLIVNHTGSPVNPLSRGILVLLMMVFLSGVALTVPHLPYVSGAAGNIFDILKSIFLTVLSFLGNVLVLMIRLMWGRTTVLPAGSDSTPSGPERQPVEGSALPPWVNAFFQVVFLAIMAVLLIVVTAILWQLLRGLMAHLLQRREGQKAPQISLNPLRFWKEAFVLITRFLKKAGCLALLFVPAVALPVDQAYLQLLWWGSWKRRPRRIYETPNDYHKRLAGYYPELSAEFQAITAAYVVYRYSGVEQTADPAAVLKPLLRKLYLFDWYRLRSFCLTMLQFRLGKKAESKAGRLSPKPNDKNGTICGK
jgi:hypothetical protein